MNETEADTRANRIDPILVAAGWGTVEGSHVRREVICPGRIQAGGRRGKSLSCDYVLFHKGQKLAAVLLDRNVSAPPSSGAELEDAAVAAVSFDFVSVLLLLALASLLVEWVLFQRGRLP